MMTLVKMFLSYNNSERVVQLPVVPDNLPEILQEVENGSITTGTKTFTLLGNKKPRAFSLTLFLPTRDYNFCKGNGAEVIELIEHVVAKKIPARLIIVDGMTELLNIAVAVKSHKHYYDKAKNIRATIDFVEYNFLNEPAKQKTVRAGAPSFSQLTVYYKNKVKKVKALMVSGKNLVRVKDICELVERDCTWNGEKKRAGCGRVLLDIYTEIHEGNAYCYIREMAYLIGLDVEYNTKDKSIVLKEVSR